MTRIIIYRKNKKSAFKNFFFIARRNTPPTPKAVDDMKYRQLAAG
jgi:hypothetical protein